MLAAIGHGGLKEGQVVNRLCWKSMKKNTKKRLQTRRFWRESQRQTHQKVHIAKSKSGIVVKGIDDMAVRFSKCCNPVPGDEIVGFVDDGDEECLSIAQTV